MSKLSQILTQLELTYRNPIENFCIYSSLLFFVIFSSITIMQKVASGKDSYSQVNRVNHKTFILYILITVTYVLIKNSLNFSTLLSLLVGSFLYLSLYYVYLFSLIGIAKKSISINILAAISELEALKKKPTEGELADYMSKNNIGFDNIREDRLKQMTVLRFATFLDNKYEMAAFGKFIHKTGSIILKIWNQKRL